ncbi:MAG: hypothetical protein JWR87_853 [Segetibacter sp.]|nr:hypothetical protein [Segetibacter sp.]
MECKDLVRSVVYSSKPAKQLSQLLRGSLFPFILFIHINAFSQVKLPVDTLKTDSSRFQIPATSTENLDEQYDVGDLVTGILHPNRPPGPARTKSGITIIPNIASNPTIGSQIGIKAVAGRKLGTDPTTYMSVAATSASITTKGIILFYVNHNIFTNSNRWNVQGNLVVAKTVTPDFGLGIGRAGGSTEEDRVLTNPDRVERVLQSLLFNFREKIYKEIFKSVFIGAGVSFDIRDKIQQREVAENALTPYNIYNNKYGFDPGNYMSNGLLFSIQYTSRDNQNRAYKGIYADAGIRVNQKWMGSTKGALQVTSDFRKYLSLSTNRPEHVIAFWNWGSYLISGALPYLELPGTGRDAGGHSGRGYTVGYFNGTRYNHSEVEYRFPITRNKFLSGVTFFHLQTANNDLGTKLFEQWQPGGGAGLRVLFNKATRTNLCLDYGFGRYGRRGFFLGLNEAF